MRAETASASTGQLPFEPGQLAPVDDKRLALLYSGLLFLPAALIALAMPAGEYPGEHSLAEPPADKSPLGLRTTPTSAELSEEDRAILEEVYRERGCSG